MKQRGYEDLEACSDGEDRLRQKGPPDNRKYERQRENTTRESLAPQEPRLTETSSLKFAQLSELRIQVVSRTQNKSKSRSLITLCVIVSLPLVIAKWTVERRSYGPSPFLHNKSR
ncbi:hypothetical protein RF11_16276 [Thelohanellus kitauei]|uniref:Uncharacterized protein n=1 Tax=Thelohanellus kitauei TaxID=669202 RepID=A0A0C2N1A4_THEKT|nr:hypothetical protein RF11_16276 [Thelohanellus kitauei]